MDLKNLDTTAACEQGFELELLHPVLGTPLGMFVKVLGRDSEMFCKLQSEQNRARMTRAQKLGGRPTLSLDEIERDTIELLAACTQSWRRVVGDGEHKGKVLDTLLVDGEELPYSRPNAVKVYTRFKWAHEQVDTAVMDRANFLKR